jgi:hypothetical protein
LRQLEHGERRGLGLRRRLGLFDGGCGMHRIVE